MKYPNPFMLLRIAQADAYCVATEYIKFPRDAELQAQALRFERYLKHPTHTLRPGQYSDDTQMSIAVAETLIDKGAHATSDDYLDAFYRCFKRDPRTGYSQGFQHLLQTSTSAVDLKSRIVPTSNKNGAAMRSVPIGVLPNVTVVRAVAAMQARLTHDSEHGVLASQAVAMMSHYALWTNEEMSMLPTFLADHDPRLAVFKRSWAGPVKGPDVGIKTAHAVCTLATLSEQMPLLDTLQTVIDWGGDTDSVAAIAWGIASTRRRHDTLPEFFERDLEPGGQYGASFLYDLGERLMTTGNIRRRRAAGENPTGSCPICSGSAGKPRPICACGRSWTPYPSDDPGGLCRVCRRVDRLEDWADYSLPKKPVKLDEPTKLDEVSYRKGVTDTLSMLTGLVVPLLVPVLIAAFKQPPSPPPPPAATARTKKHRARGKKTP